MGGWVCAVLCVCVCCVMCVCVSVCVCVVCWSLCKCVHVCGVQVCSGTLRQSQLLCVKRRRLRKCIISMWKLPL